MIYFLVAYNTCLAGRGCSDPEFMWALVNCEIKKNGKEIQKQIWIFLCQTLKMFWLIAKFNHWMAFVENVKKIDAPKCYSQKHFGASIFLPCLPQMSFHDEALQAMKTFVNVWHTNNSDFFKCFPFFFVFTVHPSSQDRNSTFDVRQSYWWPPLHALQKINVLKSTVWHMKEGLRITYNLCCVSN